MADVAAEHAPPSALAPLPHAVVLSIFAQLPVDLRARCACVCRGWRAALWERALWTRLDVSRTSGVTVAVTDALLRGAAARAGGLLSTLDVSGSRAVSSEALLAVATANAGTLRELRVCHGTCDSVDVTADNLLSVGAAEALLRAAPRLRVLDADVSCESVAEARHALRAEGLLAPLRAHGLRVDANFAADLPALELADAVASHAWLQEVCLFDVLLMPGVLNTVAAAALARRYSALWFVGCGFTAACAPALARLLGSGSAARDVHVGGYGGVLLDAPGATLLAGALRANAALTSLHRGAVDLWDDVAAAVTLLGALAAHPSLRTLSLSHNPAHGAGGRAGAALGALLAANAPALTELNVDHCWLGDAGMAPLFQALPANTHLRTLKCGVNNITEAFAAAVLLPAVRANASLRALDTHGLDHTPPGAREAEDVVFRRAAAH
jgi:hypothetical protein